MKRRMLIMLTSLAILFGCIFGFKLVVGYMIGRSLRSNQMPIVTVSAMQATYSPWQPQVKAVGSLRAVLGVNVTTEVAGMVRTVYFTPGQMVPKGALLVQINIDPDVAQLHALQATTNLAKITYERDKKQYAVHAVSKQTVDTDEGNLQSDEAQVEKQIATIAQKTIRAPFAGRMGISLVYPGQYLNPGDKVASLETLDPIYVDFYVPQSQLAELTTGQSVMLTTDSYPNEMFTGKVTTVDSAVDANTRNIEIEATIDNPKNELVPGMFAAVQVATGGLQRYLTLPQTAVSFYSYGEVIYILKPTNKKENGQAVFTANQVFVTTGETRGDQIAILTGLNAGDRVVTSGQLKLRNGSQVVINNAVLPPNNPAPKVVNE